MSTAQHFSSSNKKQEKIEVFKPDWKTFGMWRDDAKRRVMGFKALKTEELVDNPTPNTVYISLSKILRKPVDLDLDPAQLVKNDCIRYIK